MCDFINVFRIKIRRSMFSIIKLKTSYRWQIMYTLTSQQLVNNGVENDVDMKIFKTNEWQY